MIISFEWTTPLLVTGEKTVTRRDWKYNHARKFRKGDYVAAYNRSPRAGGKQIATIKLTRSPYRQWLHDMTDEDEVKEGGVWGSAQKFREFMGKDRQMWVVEFEVVSIVDEDIHYEKVR